MVDDSALPLKRTPLFSSHQKLGAKIVPFAGWEMPVLYSGVIAEHIATRTAAGLFDVSHMGEIRVRGEQALSALNYLSCNDVSKISDGQAQYGAVLNEQGGIIDDIIIYRISPEEFMICVNASNTDSVFAWMKEKNQTTASFENESASWGQIAIQGPRAVEIAEAYFDCNLSEIKYFRFREIDFAGNKLLVARTGYTGEDGFEIFIPAAQSEQIWSGLLEKGRDKGLVACGLGARDTLRLEACLPLHGHELSPSWTALQSGLERFISFEKGDFIGRSALDKQRSEGLPSILAGFVLEDPGIARQGDKIFGVDSELEIGFVTSGTKTPTLNKALGLALLNQNSATIGSKIAIEIRGKKVKAEVVSTPFYKRNRKGN